MPKIKFCEEHVVAQRDFDIDPKDKLAVQRAIDSCYQAVQPTLAPRLMPGFTVKETRCTDGHDGKDKPKNSA